MYTVSELDEAINDLNNGAHTISNVSKLASVYTVLDHLYPTERENQLRETIIDKYGNTDFLNEVAGKPARDVWLLVDDLVQTLAIINPKLLDNFLNKLSEIKG